MLVLMRKKLLNQNDILKQMDCEVNNVELIIISLLVMIIILVLYFIFKKGNENTKILDLVVKNHLEGFRREIEGSMQSSKNEMTNARVDLNRQATDTLKFLVEMQSTMEKVISQQEEANKLGQSLKDVLAMPKLRGNYGEIILEDLLEKILPIGMWERQYKISNGCVVDAVVKYKDLIVPIDAKFPRDNYLNYLESEQKQDKDHYWRLFERDLLNQIKETAKYVQPEHGTADFALMFIPSEAVYYETLADKNFYGQTSKIAEALEKQKVIAVSPRNFYAFLQIVLTSMRNLEVLNHAREVQNKLVKLQKKYGHFYFNYEKIGLELNKAYEAYKIGDKHIGLYKKELDEILDIEEVEENIV